jgi:hypothetical protein
VLGAAGLTRPLPTSETRDPSAWQRLAAARGAPAVAFADANVLYSRMVAARIRCRVG